MISRSNDEAKFKVIAQRICELLWIKIIPDDLKINWREPMKIYCDKKLAINITYNPIKYDCTKHVEVDKHFLKEKLECELICTPYVFTKNQLANIFTKRLNNHTFKDITNKLEMVDLYHSVWTGVLKI